MTGSRAENNDSKRMKKGRSRAAAKGAIIVSLALLLTVFIMADASDSRGQDDAVLAAGTEYSITGNVSASYTVTKNGSPFITVPDTIQNVIGEIKTDAAGSACTINFDRGKSAYMQIGFSNLTFGAGWGEVTLLGDLQSSYVGTSDGVITVNDDVSVIIDAHIRGYNSASLSTVVQFNSSGTLSIIGGNIDATNNYKGIVANGTGTVTVSGGTVSSVNESPVIINNVPGPNDAFVMTGGTVTVTGTADAVRSLSSRPVIISGGTVSAANGTSVSAGSTGSVVLGGNPVLIGSINVYAGTLSADGTFAPSTGKMYTIDMVSPALGNIAVAGGENFLAYFEVNTPFALKKDSGNLIVATTYTLTPGTVTGLGTVDVSVNGSSPVSFSGPMVLADGTEITLIPNASSYNIFSMWTGGAGGNASPYAFTLDNNITIGALFCGTAPGQSYDLTLWTTVTGGNIMWSVGGGIPAALTTTVTLPVNTTVDLVPAADAGYAFSVWTNALGGNAATESILMDSDKTIGALFYDTSSGQYYTLYPGTASNGSITYRVGGIGTPAVLTSAVTLPIDTQISVDAIADAGYGFSYWTDDLWGSTHPLMVQMNADLTVGAVFYDILSCYTLYPWTHDGGIIQWSADNVNWDDLAAAVTFPANTVVYIEAVPTTDPFVTWTKDMAGVTLSSTSVTMTSDLTIGALFTSAATYNLTPVASAMGTMEITHAGTGGLPVPFTGTETVTIGDTVTITAINGTGTFSYWMGISGLTPTITFIADDDHTIEAVFTGGTLYTLTPAVPAEGGRIFISIDGNLSAEFDSAVSLEAGTPVSFAPVANSNYGFSYWTGDLGGNDIAPAFVMPAGNAGVGAVFYSTASGQSFTLSPGPMMDGTVWWSVGGGTAVAAELISAVTFPYNTAVDIEAAADAGHTFSYWTGSLGGNASPRTVTMDSDLTVTAVFYANAFGQSYILSPGTAADGKIFWSVDGGVPDELVSSVIFPSGTLVGLMPEADIGYEFSYWTGGLGGNAVLGYVDMTGDITVGAVFSDITTAVTLMPGIIFDGNVMWSVGGGIPAALMSPVTLPVNVTVDLIPYTTSGYAFSAWTGDLGGNAASESIVMSTNRTVGAVFYGTAPGQSFVLTPGPAFNGSIMWSVNGGAAAALTSPAVFPAGTAVTLTPSANAGYAFSCWTGALGGNAYLETVIMDGPLIVGALFYDTASYYTLDADPSMLNGKIMWSVSGGAAAELPATGMIFPVGTVVNVEAVGISPYVFVYWNTYLSGMTPANSVVMNSNVTVGAVFAEFAVIIFIGTDSGITPEYSVDESPWGPPVLISPGTYVILDAVYGSSLEMRVTPIDGYEAVWDDGSALRVTGPAYAKAVRGDMTITLGFVSLTPVTDTVDNILDEYMWLWPLIFLAIVAATIIAVLVNRRGGIIGFVRCDGKGVSDVTVGYTADGEVGYSAVSNKDGRFRIKASKDTELVITSVTKSGYEAAGDLPGPMISEKKAAEMEIVMKEV